MTRGRTLGALVTVGILLVSACSSGDPQDVEPVEAAATSTGTTDLQREPHPGGPLPEATTDGLWLPLAFEDAAILDPGWGSDVHYADGVFLGATDHGDHLTYAAVDVHGELLWQAERPSGSTEFSLRTDDEGTTVAVLPDTGPDGTSMVSGHDLATGELVWGPENPPGPGTADTDATTAGPGVTTHEDPTTGTLLTLTDTTLRAQDAQGTELWSLSVTADTRVEGLAGGLLYLREGDAVRVHNVVTGAVAQAYDPQGEGRVVVPRMMVTQGATLLVDGDRSLIAPAPAAPPSG